MAAHSRRRQSAPALDRSIIRLLSPPAQSRVQNSPKVAGQTPKYNWTYPSLAIIAREEGFGALYKGAPRRLWSINLPCLLTSRTGFLPKVLRLAPGGGVLLLVVEAVLGGVRNYLGPPYI
jgi:solute carrier family 25 2-oxodicarboxylate transporter 21